MASIVGDQVNTAWGVGHTQYQVAWATSASETASSISLDWKLTGKVAIAAGCFGLTSVLFVELMHGISEAFKRTITENDPSVSITQGLMTAEKGWLFHRKDEFMYAVTASKTRVTLHAMPMYCNEAIHRVYKKLIVNGDFGKGCIRFKPHDTVDIRLIARLIADCAKAACSKAK